MDKKRIVKAIEDEASACHKKNLPESEDFCGNIQEDLPEGICYHHRSQRHFFLHETEVQADEIIKKILNKVKVKKLEVAGNIRRSYETVNTIDIIAMAEDPAPVVEAFITDPMIDCIREKEKTFCSVRMFCGPMVNLRVVPEKSYSFALMYYTGSRKHRTALQKLALELGYILTEFGLFDKDTNLSIELKSEEEIYRKLDLQYIRPELREMQGEIEASKKNSIPDLIEYEDIRGVFHIHSTYSDGLHTIREYIEKAREKEWEYIGISDHSQTANYAGGLPVEKIMLQHREIEELNKEYTDFRIFKGIESDILPNGSLDYTDEILGQFDFVIASVHSNFNMTRDEMTRRVVRAIENPYTTMLGHPTGRLLLTREGYSIDLDAVIKAAAENNVIIELNVNPFRLELDWRYIKKAIDSGIMISINPDAHRLSNLEFIKTGIGIARKGWCQAANVFNTKSPGEIDKILSKK
jgi:DNA polymerase (family X)